MTIAITQGTRLDGSQGVQELSEGTPQNQVQRNRELRNLVNQLNEGLGSAQPSELRFAVDRATGRPVIKIVDRVTNETISQIPSETLLRLAEVLKTLQPGDRIA